MADFDATEFLSVITWEKFDELTKPKLLKLGQHFELGLETSLRKQEIKNEIIDALVDEKIFDESVLEHKVESDMVKLKQLEIHKELELKKLEMEIKIKEQEMQARLDYEKTLKQQELDARLQMEQKERDEKLKMEQKEREEKLAMEKMQVEVKIALDKEKLEKYGSSDSSNTFDATNNIRLVPKFTEKEVDKFFLHFEKVATTMKWPKHQWMVLLHTGFTGKAREVYSALPLHDCEDYEKVKQAILKAYELVPEAYRQKFRNARKTNEQTHVEFAQLKEQMLDRWLTSKEVNKNFDQLRQLMLIEEFKWCIHPDIRTHLNESKVNDLHEASTKADDYAITHKLSEKPPKFQAKSNDKRSDNHDDFIKPKPDSFIQNRNKPSSSARPKQQYGGMSGTFKSKVTCYNCGQPGHVKSQCPKLTGSETMRKLDKGTVGCTVGIKTDRLSSLGPIVQKSEIVESGNESEKVREDFEPFVLDGVVSLNNGNDAKPIKIMRDTCCSQSLILEGVLPFDGNSFTETNALIRGIGMEVISVPLHRMNLKSDLVCGEVVVGVRPELPVAGVSMLLGNDLAGVKVLPEPVVSNQPCFEKV